MSSYGVGVDLGPTRLPRAIVFVDPRHPERLIVRGRPLAGCGTLLAVGAFVVACLGAAVPDSGGIDGSWVLTRALPFGLVSLLVLFRSWLIIDRKRHTVTTSGGVLWPWRRSTESCRIASVHLERADDVSTDEDGDSQTTTTFPVSLEGGGRKIEVGRAGVWEAAVPLAETLARFLEVTLDDRAQGRVSRPDELDHALWRQPIPRKRVTMAPASRLTMDRAADGTLVIDIPRTHDHSYLGLAVVVLILWTLPVGLFGSLRFGLLPLAIVLGSWVKVAFGYSATLRIHSEGLDVVARGLVASRRVDFPGDELEELTVVSPESGGPRNALAFAFDGMVVARSDRAAARFGHGLSKEELYWLVAVITRHLSSRSKGREPVKRPQKAAVEPLVQPWPAMVGLALGSLVAWLTGGVFAICLAAPFLEHVINVGGLLGLIIGLVVEARRRGWRPELRAAILVTVVMIAALAGHRQLMPEAGLVAAGPAFDELGRVGADVGTGPVESLGWAFGATTLGIGLWLSLVATLGTAFRIPWREHLRRAPWRRVMIGSVLVCVTLLIVVAWLAREELVVKLATAGHDEWVRRAVALEHELVNALHANGKSLLHLSAETGDPDQTVFLLDRWQQSAVLLAVPYPTIVRFLLARGADPNHPAEKGTTALMVAAERYMPELVEVLLEAHAEPDSADMHGRTALHRAAAVDHKHAPRTVAVLLRHGAHPAPLDNDGMTPLDHARATGFPSFADLLRSAMAARGLRQPYRVEADEP